MKISNSTHAQAQSPKAILDFHPTALLLAPLRLCVIVFIALLSVPAVNAQEVADTIKVRTRVVFMDALVKDKHTGIKISDLNADSFEVIDDGKPRTISYFTREGQARKPLALVMILDLRDDGAGRFLKRDEVRKAMIDELAKLPPGDEIAILAINLNSVDDKTAAIRNGKALWLTEFTRDPAKLAAALARVPALVAPAPEPSQPENEKAKESKGTMTVESDSDTSKASDQPKPKQDTEVVETETIKGKNGAVVTRTTRKDGTVTIKRVNSKGDITIQLDDIYDMAGATRDAAKLAQDQRPNSQAALIWLSDGIAPIFKEDRDATEQILVRQNVIFNSLTVDLRTLYKFLLPIGRPMAGWFGVSLYGSAKQFAQESGGEALHLGRIRDYGAGLAQIIGNLTARYNLGFAIGEAEKDDGRMHQLDLRVKALDAKGKQRKLLVSARKGYYMPKSDGDQTSAVVK